MKNFQESQSNTSASPIKLSHGSFLPGDVLSRAARVLQEKLTGTPRVLKYPMRVIRGDFSKSYPNRLLSKIVAAEGGAFYIVPEADGSLSAYFQIETGEELHGERVIHTISLEDIGQIKRLAGAQTHVNVGPNRLMPVISTTALTATTDFIPGVAEVALIFGVAVTALAEVRVRFGVETQDGDHFVADIRETGYFFLDSLINTPIWDPTAETVPEPVEDI